MIVRRLFFVGSLLLILAICSQFAAAKDIYVDNVAGRDINSGITPQNTGDRIGPVRSIAQALKIAKAGDRIVLKANPVPYMESITLFGSKNSGAIDGTPFVIEAKGAVLEGADPLSCGVWGNFKNDIYRFRPSRNPINLSTSQLFSDGNLLERIKTTPDMKAVPELLPLQWCVFRGFVYFRAESGKSPGIPGHYKLSYSARPSGITLLHVNNVRIHDLTVRGFQVDGISAHNCAKDVVIDNVFSKANGRSGLSAGVTSRVMAGYCEFSENGTSQVLALRTAKILLYGCLTPETSAAGIENRGGSVQVEPAPDGVGAQPYIEPETPKPEGPAPLPEAKTNEATVETENEKTSTEGDDSPFGPVAPDAATAPVEPEAEKEEPNVFE